MALNIETVGAAGLEAYPDVKMLQQHFSGGTGVLLSWDLTPQHLKVLQDQAGAEFWKPRQAPPTDWNNEAASAPGDSVGTSQDKHQKPWPFCPICGAHPKVLYIDCREVYMLRTYNEPHTEETVPVPLLPITYPLPGQMFTVDLPQDKDTLTGASKVVGSASLRKILRRWSGHVPVTQINKRDKLTEVQVAIQEPLKEDELQKLEELPSCVRNLIEVVNGAGKTLCPSPAYAPLFYHLGYMHSDSVLLKHGAQEAIVALLVTLKLAGRKELIEIHCEWDEALDTYAPLLQRVIHSCKAKTQTWKGFQVIIPPPPAGLKVVRKSSGYSAKVAMLRALAPLLQHLLRLSFYTNDYITWQVASDKLCEALGVKSNETWLAETVGGGRSVDPAEAWAKRGEIRDLMSGPCRGTYEYPATEKYILNQQRLSSSNTYHRVFRAVPQYVGRDASNGMCLGGERDIKCLTEAGDEKTALVTSEGKAKKKPPRADTDGVMVGTCKHRFVYYFHILLRHESLRDIFTFLSTRFEHRPPEIIVYDNACELSRYCEGRWPEFFAKTMFLTDVFHGVNHRCSDEFKYNKHRLDEGRELQNTRNTSVSEQINQLMMRLDKTATHFTIGNGMLVYDHFVYMHNTQLHKEWLAHSKSAP